MMSKFWATVFWTWKPYLQFALGGNSNFSSAFRYHTNDGHQHYNLQMSLGCGYLVFEKKVSFELS